mmetsp:Transcript_34341/g.67872  ORF Transcript_34341/g.67872 Transcript_34341/m.67872 type:complete len:86 (+) Transcript_34341:246-503(+)
MQEQSAWVGLCHLDLPAASTILPSLVFLFVHPLTGPSSLPGLATPEKFCSLSSISPAVYRPFHVASRFPSSSKDGDFIRTGGESE